MEKIHSFLKTNKLVSITFVLIAVFFARSVHPDSDTFWNMSVGRQIWDNQKIVIGNWITDQYVIGRQSTKFAASEWISQLAYYFTYNSFGQTGLIFLRISLGLLTLFFFYKTISLFTKNTLTKNALLILLGYMISMRFFDRPENFGFVLLSLLNYFLLSYYFKNKFKTFFYFTPLIFLLWPNIHPTSSIGFGLFSGFVALFFIEKFIFKKNSKNLRNIFITWGISLIFVSIQLPKVFNFFHLSKIESLNIGESRGLGEFLSEAITLNTFAHIPYSHFVYLALLVVWLILVVLVLFRLKKEFSILPLIFLYSTVLAFPWLFQRIIPFSIMLTLPLVLYLAKQKINLSKKYSNPIFILIYIIFAYLISVSIFSGNIVGFKKAYKIWFLKDGSSLRAMSVQTKFWTGEFPQKAPEIISKHLSSKRVLSSIVWSNYLIWNLPDIKVTANGMNEFYTPEELKNELNLINGTGNWKQLIEKLQIDTVVKGQELTVYSNKTPIHELPDWKLIYVNETFALYAKPAVIRSLPLDLSKLHPELSSTRKFYLAHQEEAIKQLKDLLVFDPQNGFAREQLILNLLEKRQYYEATNLASASRKLLPENPYFSLYLAAIKAANNQCQQANEFIKETEELAGGNLEIISRLKPVKKLCNLD